VIIYLVIYDFFKKQWYNKSWLDGALAVPVKIIVAGISRICNQS